MIVWRLCWVLLLLAALLGTAPAAAQYAPGKPDPGLEEMKYRAIYGRPPPPPEEETQSTTSTGRNQGETTTTEPPPRYRFENDPLLNPPGSRAPQTEAPAQADGEARAPAATLPSPLRRPADLITPSAALPKREIQVVVVDDDGKPVPLAQVSLSTRQQPFFVEGLTGEDGSFSASVPCYVPGGQNMLSHELTVTSPSGSMERLLVTRQGNCGLPDQVSVILADPNRLNDMIRRYRERQELYEEEEEEQKAKEEKALEQEQAQPGQGGAAGGAKGTALPGLKK